MSTAMSMMRAIDVTPRARPAGSDRHAIDVGSASFSDLLQRAKGVQTHRPVSVGRDISVELSAEQLARVAKAVDQAEAAGAVRALVMLDGKPLTVDVQMRQIIEADERDVLTNIDTVVFASAGKAGASAELGPPAAPMTDLNASLVKTLARHDDET